MSVIDKPKSPELPDLEDLIDYIDEALLATLAEQPYLKRTEYSSAEDFRYFATTSWQYTLGSYTRAIQIEQVWQGIDNFIDDYVLRWNYKLLYDYL